MHRPPEQGYGERRTRRVRPGDGPVESAGNFSPTGLAGELEALRERLLPGSAVEGLDDGQRLELLRELELLTRTVAGASARLQVGFHASQVGRQVDDGVAPSRAGRAVPDDLAMARMCSPYWGSRDLTSAKALVNEMPRTFMALCDGTISSYQARLVTEGTSCVTTEHRTEIDERLAERLPGIGHRELEAAVRALVYEVDPQGYVARARKAAEDRGVSVRPLPDVMAVLSARLPAEQAIAAYRSIDLAARLKRASGDPRTLQQLRADELYERLTGRAVVDGIDIEVGLVITDSALFEGTTDPAELLGYGPVPADYARDLLRPPAGAAAEETSGAAPDGGSEAGQREPCPAAGSCTDSVCTFLHGSPDRSAAAAAREGVGNGSSTEPDSSAQTDSGTQPGSSGSSGSTAGSGSIDQTGTTRQAARAAKVWLRRLYTDPVTGWLVERDPRRRFFTGSLRAFIVARDRTCRTPWCGASVRAVDHVVRHADGGPTTEDNGQGTCERCNLARERPRTLHPGPETFRPPPPLLPIFPRRTRAP